MKRQIKIGYGQFAQDWFVNIALGGKEKGFFLDIGCGTSDWPADQVVISTMSNSYGLEEHKKWDGVAIDYDTLYFEVASKLRNTVVCADLLKTNINSILEEKNCPKHMDYLSFDVDEAQRKVLDELDFDKYSFSVITYEHNYSLELANPDSVYAGDKDYSRDKFEKLGYKLLFGNVGLTKDEMIEDWWVSEELYTQSIRNEIHPQDGITVVEIVELFIKKGLA